MTLLGAALAYARRGRAVFPLDGKVPRTKNGLKSATTDATVIRGWWDRWTDAGIGLPMGDGWIAVDVDGDKGRESLASLVDAHGSLPDTLVNLTARGAHLIFKIPAGRKIGNRIDVRPGIDVRSDGGYIVAPPSVHPSGYVYRWQPAPVAEIPLWLLEVIVPTPAPRKAWTVPTGASTAGRARAWADAALRHEAREVARATEGTRNGAANRALVKLGHLVGGGLLERSTVENMIASACEAAGLGDGEIRQLLRPRGGLDVGAAEPVTGPRQESAA